jgi:tripartite-type tricarboxylate transporter receptor subunit TctC
MNNVGPGAAVFGLLLAVTCGHIAPTSALAQDWKPEFVYGKLQPLPDGFPSGPITIIAAGEEGSVPGLLALRLYEYSKLYTPVDVKVEYRPEIENYGAWQALKEAAGAEGGDEGYINVIFESPDDLITLHTKPVAAEVGVGLDDLSEVVSIEDHRYAVIQCKDAAWEPTWAALVQQIKENPGKVRYAGGEKGDRLDLVFAEYMQVAELGGLYDEAAVAYSNVGDVAARTQAVVACDADVTVTDMEQLITEKLGEQGAVLLVTGKKKLAKHKDAPTAADVGMADDPMSRTMQVVVPATVDPLHVKWLNALWTKTGKDSYFKAGRVLDEPVNLSNVLDAEASAAWNDAADARMAELANTLGIAAGQ